MYRRGFFKLSKGLDSVTASFGICEGEIAVGSLGLFFCKKWAPWVKISNEAPHLIAFSG